MEQDQESIGAASRALADAATQLVRALGSHAKESADAGADFGNSVAQSLHGAARDIAAASAALSDGLPRKDDRRQRKADRTRADLLEAGMRVFAAKGYEGASVDDIAREAGYTKGAVYSHFGSKRDLFVTIALGGLDQQTTCAEALPGVDADGVNHEALAEHLGRIGDDPSMLLALEVLAYALRHPEDATELAASYRASFEKLAVQVAALRHQREEAAGGRSEGGTKQEDYDTVLGVLAVLNWATLGVHIIGEPLSADSGARIIARLLS